MNRAQRRQLERAVKRRSLKNPTPDSVTLRGGPMDGWTVQPGAPALEPDWRAKYLEEAARGLYEQAVQDNFHRPLPSWNELPDAERQQYRETAKRERGDGRYVLGEPGRPRYADWVAALAEQEGET